MKQTRAVFQCPDHGLERELLCWQARDPKNRSGWQVEESEVEYKPMPDETFEKINQRICRGNYDKKRVKKI